MRKFLVILAVLIVLAVILGYRFYNKAHRSVEDEDALRTNAIELFNAFQKDETAANDLFLDNVVEVTGVVSEILSNQDGDPVLVLKTNDPLFGISCTMSDDVAFVKAGMELTIRGICTGYLSDVVITQGILIE